MKITEREDEEEDEEEDDEDDRLVANSSFGPATLVLTSAHLSDA